VLYLISWWGTCNAGEALATVAAFKLGSGTNPICIYKGLRVRCGCSSMYCGSGVNESTLSTQGGGEELAETLDADSASSNTRIPGVLSHVSCTLAHAESLHKEQTKRRLTTLNLNLNLRRHKYQNHISHQNIPPTCLSVVYAPAWSAPSSKPAPNSCQAAAPTANTSSRCVTVPMSCKIAPAPSSRA
jgi:hypothetical protein